MVSHILNKLDGFPFAFVVVFAIGIFVPSIIALSTGHVSPYVPYISEGGGQFPEAGIFSMLITASTILSQWIIFLRYLVVEQLNSLANNHGNTFLNKISFALGVFSTFSLIVVASFPTTSIPQVHNSAAGIACVCLVMYLICQTWISYRIMGRTKESNFRLVITIFSTIALILVTTFGVLGSTQWTADHLVGKKTPQDKGFIYYVISASAEWAMAILLMIFFASYIPEFRKSTFQFDLQLGGTAQKPHLTNLDIRRPQS